MPVITGNKASASDSIKHAIFEAYKTEYIEKLTANQGTITKFLASLSSPLDNDINPSGKIKSTLLLMAACTAPFTLGVTVGIATLCAVSSIFFASGVKKERLSETAEILMTADMRKGKLIERFEEEFLATGAYAMLNQSKLSQADATKAVAKLKSEFAGVCSKPAASVAADTKPVINPPSV